MASDDLDPMFDVLTATAFEAAFAPVGFLAALSAALIKAGAVSFSEVEDCLQQERHLIEGLRREGDDPRLRALVAEKLQELIEYRLDAERKFPMAVRPWTLDEQRPDWPHYPSDPEED